MFMAFKKLEKQNFYFLNVFYLVNNFYHHQHDEYNFWFYSFVQVKSINTPNLDSALWQYSKSCQKSLG